MAAPLPQHIVDYIVQLQALGNTVRQIKDKVSDRYSRTVHEVTISRIRKRHENDINDAQDKLAARSDIIGADVLKQKSYRLLNRKLERAEEDDSQIAVLRSQLQSGEIDRETYESEAKKYEVMTVAELTKIADSMHQHAKGGDGGGNVLSPEDQAVLELITKGLSQGNPLALVKVVNQQLNVHPTAENPAPPAGSTM